MTFNLVASGYNPVLMSNGESVNVIPDFMVANALSTSLRKVGCSLTVPNVPIDQKAFWQEG